MGQQRRLRGVRLAAGLTRAVRACLTRSSPRALSRSPAIQIETAVRLVESSVRQGVESARSVSWDRKAGVTVQDDRLTWVDPVLADCLCTFVAVEEADHVHDLELLSLTGSFKDDGVPPLARLREVIEVGGRVDPVVSRLFLEPSVRDLKEEDGQSQPRVSSA